MANSCPICDNSQYKILGKSKTNSISSKFVSEDYRVVQCNICKTYFVSPYIKFDDEQWSLLYNSEYFTEQSKWLIKQRAKELKERFDRADSYLNNNKEIRFLDVGTGEGKTLIEGSSRRWEVYGIDIVDNRIDAAKKENINFIKGKFLEYEFPENHFDFIYLDSVLEHVLEPLDYLKKIKQILKPGGILYLGVPNEDSLFNDIRRLVFNIVGRKELSEKIKPFDSPYHVIGFNNSSLNYTIKHLGFKVKYFRNFGRKFNFLGNPIGKKRFWISLIFLFPIEVLGNFIKRDVYFETYLTK